MARAYLILVFLLLCTLDAHSQSSKEMMAEIEGKWELDDNDNITILKVIELPEFNREQIFARVLNYFAYNYGSGKSVIQIQDKENGLIIGKGIYDNVHVGLSFYTTNIDTWHILRVDIKEGRARVMVTLTEYEKEILEDGAPAKISTVRIASQHPINSKAYQKGMMTKAFYKSFMAANNTLSRIETAIRNGNTYTEIENSGW